jgi:hypothetical protein
MARTPVRLWEMLRSPRSIRFGSPTCLRHAPQTNKPNKQRATTEQNAERAMALLEERYRPGLSTRAALALALDCCRALQQQQGGGKEGGGEGSGSGSGSGDGNECAALDVALISPEGVRLERVSPPEVLLSLLAPEEKKGDEG